MSVEVLTGDCRSVLAGMPAKSAHCCVVSPPYFGLRDYGTGEWRGGDAACDHRSPTMREGRNEDLAKLAGSAATNSAQLLLAHRSACGKCGAVKVDSQIGLERTPDEFVAQLVAVFREVRRVLRDDGTLWLNLGDSYAGSWRAQGRRPDHPKTARNTGSIKQDGLKPKDLIGIPWMVAFALRADGWYLRQDIIWNKPNPMPESVGDRCTKSHEYIFLLSKSPKYFYDADAIAEPASYSGLANQDESGFKAPQSFNGKHKDGYRSSGNKERKSRAEHGGSPGHGGNQAFGVPWEGNTRNKRSVWTVPTAPYSEAHFATFPPALIEPCIKAGCPEGGTVLDPFGGAGTTGLVADRLRRSAILIELNPAYAEMARRRIYDDAPLFQEAAQ